MECVIKKLIKLVNIIKCVFENKFQKIGSDMNKYVTEKHLSCLSSYIITY